MYFAYNDIHIQYSFWEIKDEKREGNDLIKFNTVGIEPLYYSC